MENLLHAGRFVYECPYQNNLKMNLHILSV
jgi:hypothetical protein